MSCTRMSWQASMSQSPLICPLRLTFATSPAARSRFARSSAAAFDQSPIVPSGFWPAMSLRSVSSDGLP